MDWRAEWEGPERLIEEFEAIKGRCIQAVEKRAVDDCIAVVRKYWEMDEVDT